MSLKGRYSIGILLTFVLLVASLLYSIPLINLYFGYEKITQELLLYSRVCLWGVLGWLILYNVFLENRSFFVWEEKKYSLPFYIGSVISLYFISLIGCAFINTIINFFTKEGISDSILEMASLFKNNYFLILFTCITAAVVEELLMRAYIQPRLEKIYNSPFMGIVGSSLLFGILHTTYGTISQFMVPFFIGIIFSMFYKKYSNIKILIICHFIFDFISIMLMNFMFD